VFVLVLILFLHNDIDAKWGFGPSFYIANGFTIFLNGPEVQSGKGAHAPSIARGDHHICVAH
jgi:hypothetical protein